MGEIESELKERVANAQKQADEIQRRIEIPFQLALSLALLMFAIGNYLSGNKFIATGFILALIATLLQVCARIYSKWKTKKAEGSLNKTE